MNENKKNKKEGEEEEYYLCFLVNKILASYKY